MITKERLQQRVNTRRQELEEKQNELTDFRERATAFVEDIKNRSVIYNLVKSLPLWKMLEALTQTVV